MFKSNIKMACVSGKDMKYGIKWEMLRYIVKREIEEE